MVLGMVSERGVLKACRLRPVMPVCRPAFRLYSRVPVYRTIYEPACSKYVTLSACLPYARTYLYEALLF